MKTCKGGDGRVIVSVYDKHAFLAAITMISSVFLTMYAAAISSRQWREQPLRWDSSPNPKPPRMRRSNQSAVSYCRIKDINWYEEFPPTPCGLALKPRCTERDFNKDYCVQVFALMKWVKSRLNNDLLYIYCCVFVPLKLKIYKDISSHENCTPTVFQQLWFTPDCFK